MNKKELCRQILETVDNARKIDKFSDDGVISEIESLIGNVLEPKDRNNFAKWGHPHQKSTYKECW